MALSAVPALAVSAADLPFTDVKTTAWYYEHVKTAYESKIIAGKSATSFDPDANLTYAEAVKLAACMNQKYLTGNISFESSKPWYQTFVDYCKENKIISKDYDWNASTTRAGYMEIFANALPKDAMKEINTIADGAIPDVSASHPQSAGIYKLYRTGIVVGVDDARNCNPASNIKRSEVSAIITRMMDSSKRVEFKLGGGGETPKPEPKPETDELKITTQPKDVTVDVGGDTTFTVDVSGGKMPYSYEWHKIYKLDGSDTKIVDGTYYSNATGPVLTAKMLVGTQSGDKYYCIVTDANGNKVTSNKATLTVKAADSTESLKIATQPKDTTVNEGDNAVFSVKASGGKTPYKYEWHFIVGSDRIADNSENPDWFANWDTEAITVKKVTHGSDDDSKYYCIISDADGNKVTSDKATLTVKSASTEALKVTTHPKDVTAKVGETVKFTVVASGGKTPYQYKWYADQDNGITATFLENTGTLTIDDLALGYNGDKIYCVITDADGKTVTSNKATLTVKAAASTEALKVTTQPKDVTAKAGETVTFTVAAAGGKTPYQYKWYVDQPNGITGTFQEKTGTLTLEGLNIAQNNNEYYCVITDADGKTVTSDKATLTVSTGVRPSRPSRPRS